jgi:hypothetical protein
MRGLHFLFGILLPVLCQSQDTLRFVTHKHREFYVYWGYNRAYYNRSDIHFEGDGYNFTLERAWAEDMPEKFDPSVYFNITQLTVPQFNFRVGYYFKKDLSLSIGWDHMKYHLIPTQYIRVNGSIDPEKYPLENHSGQFDHAYFLYNPAFMNFHHSDGLNFIRVALEKRMPFWQSKNKKFAAALYGGVSAGAMMPWTDFTFFGDNYANKPHFSGYGMSVLTGARFEMWKHFFMQINAQCGWSNLPDILLQWPESARASQRIVFLERSWALGAYIGVKKQKARG